MQSRAATCLSAELNEQVGDKESAAAHDVRYLRLAPAGPSLSGLPTEIKLEIVEFLYGASDPKRHTSQGGDVLALCTTTRRWQTLCAPFIHRHINLTRGTNASFKKLAENPARLGKFQRNCRTAMVWIIDEADEGDMDDKPMGENECGVWHQARAKWMGKILTGMRHLASIHIAADQCIGVDAHPRCADAYSGLIAALPSLPRLTEMTFESISEKYTFCGTLMNYILAGIQYSITHVTLIDTNRTHDEAMWAFGESLVETLQALPNLQRLHLLNSEAVGALHRDLIQWISPIRVLVVGGRLSNSDAVGLSWHALEQLCECFDDTLTSLTLDCIRLEGVSFIEEDNSIVRSATLFPHKLEHLTMGGGLCFEDLSHFRRLPSLDRITLRPGFGFNNLHQWNESLAPPNGEKFFPALRILELDWALYGALGAGEEGDLAELTYLCEVRGIDIRLMHAPLRAWENSATR